MKKIDKFRGKYSFLSNFYPCFVYYDGFRYPSAEHAFQAAKTLDEDDRIAMRVCPSSEEAKQTGKTYNLREDWNDIKLEVMEEIVRSKFTTCLPDKELKAKLLATGDAYLEEGNSHRDNFWGTYKGEGRNELGKILMKIREELRVA